MLKLESSGSRLTNPTPVASGARSSKSGGECGLRSQPASASAPAIMTGPAIRARGVLTAEVTKSPVAHPFLRPPRGLCGETGLLCGEVVTAEHAETRRGYSARPW